MRKGVPFKSYLLASKNGSLSELFSLLEEISFVPKPKLKLPEQFLLNGAKILDKYHRHIKGAWDPSYDPVRAEMGSHYWSVKPSNAQKDLDFNPIDPYQTLRDTIIYIIENYHQNTMPKL